MASEISRANIEESIIMMSGSRWSDYARILAKPDQANPASYAAYLLDVYSSPQIPTPTGKALEAYIVNHKTMKPEEKAFLLSQMAGQMTSVDLPRATEKYLEISKSAGNMIESGYFTSMASNLGMRSLTQAQALAVADAAARGDGAGMDKAG